MKDKLKELLNNAYAPYSGYKVSCIVITKDGREFYGVNVENASYGGSICAERNAILNAITNGYHQKDFKEIHIMNSSDKIGSPCFICRQTFTEFFDEDVKIKLYNINNAYAEYQMKDLCPVPFDNNNLK